MAEEKKHCKAIISQGPRKGLLCERDPVHATVYCNRHQRNHVYDTSIQEGKKVCGMFFRGCDQELSVDDLEHSYRHCKSCRVKKSGKEFPCQYTGCNFMIKEETEKYCKKHIRQHLCDNEKTTGIKYCDINRGCFQPIIDGSCCELCKHKAQVSCAQEIQQLRMKYNIICDEKQSVNDQYPLSYMYQERAMIRMRDMWRLTQRNAYDRNLLFVLTQEDLERLTLQACHYCGFYSRVRLNGVDRVDNNKGYILDNCVSCCKMCNLMKRNDHPAAWVQKVCAIYEYVSKGTPIPEELIQRWRPSYCSIRNRLTYNAYKSDALQRGLEFNLTPEEYTALLTGPCYLCGIETKDGHENGIDRVHSEIRAYDITNSRTCCGHCNIMKKDIPYEMFLEKCKQIYDMRIDLSKWAAIIPSTSLQSNKELYTDHEVAHLLTHGGFMAYIEWCREHNRSPEYMDAINSLYYSTLPYDELVSAIHSEMTKERSRKKTEDEQLQMKTMNCISVYCYLTQGKKDIFVRWIKGQYQVSQLFDEKLEELVDQIPSLTRENGIEACKKFMYDEKNRRLSQQRRENKKKLDDYTSHESVESDKSDNDEKNDSEETHAYPIDSMTQRIIQTQTITGYQRVTAITTKQWKASTIYDAISNNQENEYKIYCESNNDLSRYPNWEKEWIQFVLSVKQKTKEESLPIVHAFVENLRRIRHNAYCASKDPNPIERDDRQQWPATTVVRAYLEGKLDTFKTFTEMSTNESPNDPKWMKRWTSFAASLDANRDSPDILKSLCSKMMIAQRTKKYRRKTAEMDK